MMRTKEISAFDILYVMFLLYFFVNFSSINPYIIILAENGFFFCRMKKNRSSLYSKWSKIVLLMGWSVGADVARASTAEWRVMLTHAFNCIRC